MAVNTETGSNVVSVRDSLDGFQHGKINAASAKAGFYGATPVTQPTSGSQATLVYTAGIGTASATSGLQALTSTYNSTLIANAIVSVAAQSNAIQAALVALGLVKGS